MDFEVLRQAVCVNELIYEGSVEQSVDSDLTLPDYCPDILRILKMYGHTARDRFAGVRRTDYSGWNSARSPYLCGGGCTGSLL